MIYILALAFLIFAVVIGRPRVPLTLRGLLRNTVGRVDYQQISGDAQRALEDFSEAFAAAFMLEATEPWSKALGFSNTSRALKTTYPIPVSAAGYHEFKGDLKYRALYEKSLELIPKTWQDGIAELASVVEAPDFIGWASEPQRIAAAAHVLPNEIIAAALEANPTSWTGQAFFSSTHPVNVFDTSAGTFSNDLTYAGTDTAQLVAALRASMAGYSALRAPSQRGPSSKRKSLMMRLTDVLVPPELEQPWKDVLENDQLILAVTSTSAFGAVNNRFKGAVNLVVCPELTETDVFYTRAGNKPGVYPWVVQDEGSPEEILHDKTSALYKTTLKVGVAYILRGNGALALPHAMQRFTLAT